MKKITVNVKTNSKRPKIEVLTNGEYLVKVKEPPAEGKANKAVQYALAEFFGVPKNQIVLVHGQTSKKKIFSVET
jgi:uncharacterized protein (TIGR00251 family)